MGANPFDDIAAELVEVRNVLALFGTELARVRTLVEGRDPLPGLTVIAATLADLRRAVAKEAPQWETLTQATAARGKGKRAILAAVAAGRIESQRVTGRGGRDRLLLSVRDLDRMFPVYQGKKKGAGNNSGAPPDPIGSCLTAPSYQAPSPIAADQ